MVTICIPFKMKINRAELVLIMINDIPADCIYLKL